MTEQEVIDKLVQVIINIETERIMAAKRGDIEKERIFEEKRCEVEFVRDTIMNGNYDENLKNQAIQIIGQYLPIDRIKLHKKGIEVGKPRNFLSNVIDKICGKKVKKDDNNPIKK